MLTIRLARTGRKKLAHYRVVAADSRRAATGKFVAQLGHYNPHSKELVLDEALTQHYLDKGAQPSSRVVRLLQNNKGVKLPEWALKNLVVKAEQAKVEPEVEAAETTPAETTEATTEPETEVESTAETTEPDKAASEEDAASEAAEPEASTDDSKKE
ncbi:MAG: 30S ribosomal protein S16 [Candidatus Saccharimonadales bacterium]